MDFEVWKSAQIAEVTSFLGSFFNWLLLNQTHSALTGAPSVIISSKKRSLSVPPNLTGGHGHSLSWWEHPLFGWVRAF